MVFKVDFERFNYVDFLDQALEGMDLVLKVLDERIFVLNKLFMVLVNGGHLKLD